MRNLDKARETGKEILRDNPHRDLTTADLAILMEEANYEHPDADSILNAIIHAIDIGVSIGYGIGMRDGQMSGDIMTLRDVATKYNVSYRTVHRWMRQKDPMPYGKFGGCDKAVKRGDLELWARKNLQKNPDGTYEYRKGESHE